MILLAEDNPDDRELALIAFREIGIEDKIVVCQDGEAVLDYLWGRGSWTGRDLSKAPRVLLLDIKLPKLDGIEVLRRLRADPRTALLPVVVLTSSREARDRLECYRLGANSYIRKPVDFTQFVETIRQLALYWITINETPYDDK
jgi:two-component system response regulator